MRLVVGDKVQWTSQSQGYAKTKTGYVAEVIPANERPDATKWPQLFGGAGPGSARPHMSYIVVADKKVYWPRVSKLAKVE